MTADIRDARSYVIALSDGMLAEVCRPNSFEEAFDRAISLDDAGVSIKVLYTEGAWQSEITLFVSRGIRTELVGRG